MSTSTFGWLDYDEAERRRMMELIEPFREQGTLDELGTGAIRDTFANLFFPGTSTIQTRARYFLFIPWIYLQLEREHVPPAQVETQARRLQWRLVQSLRAGGEGSNAGLIGIDAGENLQRLPAAIYWQGLRTWGIRLVDGSMERYPVSMDGRRQGERAAKASEGGELLDAARRDWHGSLAPAPADLLEATSFVLTHAEAEFLVERIRRSCAGSLLSECLTPAITRLRNATAPWELGGLDTLDERLQQDIAHARRYSLAMEGAVLLYNLMLAELAATRSASPDTARIEHYRAELERWSGEMHGTRDDLSEWDREDLWLRLRKLNPLIYAGAERFSSAWIERAVADPRSVWNDEDARKLISDRELRMKRRLARLHNPRALERWSGASGVGRLTFRWGNAKRILLDIRAGLSQAQDLP